MNRLVVGADYVRAITASESDRLARAAFQALVMKIARPGAALYDFGAGAGIDARWYAARGFAVGAYDVDPDMRKYFLEYCREPIAAGRVSLDGGTYAEFLANPHLNRGRRVDLVTANFAPLSLIEDLPALFAKFHSLTAPGGQVLASVLSPYFAGDLRYRWWWRNLPQLLVRGSYAVRGAQAPIIRRRLGALAAACAPYFTLERIYPGLPLADGQPPRGAELKHRARTAWLGATRCRYMFLQFAPQCAD